MKGVQLTKLAQELNLTNLTPDIDLTEIYVKTAEINRPALQLTGYLEHFANERVQIIGYVEYTYLMQLSDEERTFKYERFISSKIPCVIFSTMTRPSQDMIDLAYKYNVPTFVTERTTSSLMAEIIRWLGVQLAPCISIHGVLVDVPAPFSCLQRQMPSALLSWKASGSVHEAYSKPLPDWWFSSWWAAHFCLCI